jgi:hypothetical protein
MKLVRAAVVLSLCVVGFVPILNTASAYERHPEIREALGALRRARNHLDIAAHDFGGHRAQAIQAIDNAIMQLEIAVRYDR